MKTNDENLDLDWKIDACGGAVALATLAAVVILVVGFSIWRLLVVILAGPLGYLLAWRRYERRRTEV